MMRLMRATALVALALIVCSCFGPSTMSVQAAERPPTGLRKALVVDPLDTPSAASALAHLQTLLGKEPPAATDEEDSLGVEGENTEDDDIMSEKDLELMAEDSKCSDLDKETGKCQKKKGDSDDGDGDSQESSDLNLDLGGSSSGSSQSHSRSSSGSGSSLIEAKGTETVEEPDRMTMKEIKRLELQIRRAMIISKTIPLAVRRLEQLKNKAEELTEAKARAEATKTLEEHRRLMGELSDHITKLRNKLNELVTKRAQLAASDSRLRQELGQFTAAKSTSSGSASSSSSSSASSSSKKKKRRK